MVCSIGFSFLFFHLIQISTLSRITGYSQTCIRISFIGQVCLSIQGMCCWFRASSHLHILYRHITTVLDLMILNLKQHDGRNYITVKVQTSKNHS